MAVISQNRQQQGVPGWLPDRANKFTSRLVACTTLRIIGYFATDVLYPAAADPGPGLDRVKVGRIFSPELDRNFPASEISIPVGIQFVHTRIRTVKCVVMEHVGFHCG